MKFSASWITSPKNPGAAAYTFKKNFKTSKEIKKATLYASALGLYVPYINGTRVGDNVLAPGWTSYNHRIQYQTYDVTPLISKNTTVEIGVGQGWAIGFIGYRYTNHYYGNQPSLIAQLDITYTDGSKEFVITDTDWDVYTSKVLSSEIYHGETIDKTAPIKKVGKAVFSEVKGKLIPQVGEFITEHERLAPVEIIRTPKGELVIDFGQNMTGYVEVRVKGNRGDRIVMHHAEVLDKDGNFYTDNFRGARNENIYILSGEDDVFKPSYTFQGFRYIHLVEFPFDKVNPDNFRAVAVHSDMKRTGSFRCGNEKINQLYHNIIWGQKSNFLDVPTDCPQRDERLGWTGDAQVFCRTAAINFDVEKFFKKWLGDLALEQHKSGAVIGIVPNCFPENTTRISAAWGDAACIVPWQIYLSYGNEDILKKNFKTMKKWVDYIHSAGPEEYLWLGGNHYGDWLAMDAGGDSYLGATSTDFIASAFFAYSTSLLIKAGEIIGKDMSEYKTLHKNILKAFRNYFMENGMPKESFPLAEYDSYPARYRGDCFGKGITQTSLTLILHFGLCTDNERPALVNKLVDLIHQNGDRMTTGFVGTPYLLHALSDNGHSDLAYTLLMQEENPSWLYSVCHGATTMWEHWNSLKEDGSFWDTAMNSFNHYAYGAVFDWIFGVACGISTVETAPAYKEITLCPHPSKALGYAKTSIDSRNGRITSHWYYKGDSVYYEFYIPEGVIAHLTLPSGYSEILTGGKYHFTTAEKDI